MPDDDLIKQLKIIAKSLLLILPKGMARSLVQNGRRFKYLIDADSPRETMLKLSLLISQLYRERGSTLKSLKMVESVRKKSHDAGLIAVETDAICKLSFLQHRLFNHAEAERLAKQALDQSRVHRLPFQEADALAMIGHIQEAKEDFEEASVKFRDALKIAESQGHLVRQVSTMSDIGRILGIRRSYMEALDYLDCAEAIAIANGMEKHLIVIFTRKGDIYRASEDYGKANQYYRQALDRAKNIDLLTDLGEIQGRLGQLELSLKHPEVALKHFGEAAKVSKRLHYRGHLYFNNLGIAEARNQMGQHATAAEILWKIIEGIKTSYASNHALLRQCLEQLGIALRNLNRPEDGERLRQLASRLKDVSDRGMYMSHQKDAAAAGLFQDIALAMERIRPEVVDFMEFKGIRVEWSSGNIWINGEFIETERLTISERKVLRRLVDAGGKCVGHRHLMIAVRSDNEGLPDKALSERLRFFIKQIRQKLQSDELIESDRKGGYRLRLD